MGMALEQLFVRVSDAPEVSPNSESCVQQVARVCGLSAAARDDDVNLCTLSGFADAKQQLAVACMLHWQLQQTKESGATVSVSDSAMGTCFSLAELLNCDKTALETPDTDAVKVLDAAAYVQQVLEQHEEDTTVQILDCRDEKEFLGLTSGKEVSGHLEGARNVPFAGDGAFLLPVEKLRELFAVNGIDLDRPVAVIASVPSEAAAVATALLLAGHYGWIAFCSEALTDALIASFPSSFTADIFHEGRLLYKDDKGGFDLSSQSNEVNLTPEGKKEVEELEKTYKDELSGKTSKKSAPGEQEEEEKVEETVWIKDGHRFFDMPSPVSKSEFLDASRTIFRVVSFVLAPFGFPASLRKKRSIQEVKTQCGSLFQDVIEVCSDLIYQEKELNEGAMAMSVHKWVEEKHDHECTAQVKAINELWEVLYTPPAVVEVPDLNEDHVLELATKLEQKLRELVSQRTPWAFDSVCEEEVEFSDEESEFDPQETVIDLEEEGLSADLVDKLRESWKHTYPSVVYALGFIPQDVSTNHKKLSTLQIKSFIQAAAEASWGVIKDEPKQLSQIEFQALCDTLHDEKREQLAERVTEAEKSLYVLKHFLTRSLKTDDSLADKLVSVREAVLDGDIRRRSGRYQVALAAYSKAFEYLPLYHKDLENAIVGRARSFLDLNELGRAKTEALIALKLNPYCVGAYECLGIVEEKAKHFETAMQHFVTSFILDGSRSAEHAESIDRASRQVGRRVAKNLFAKMEKKHELPSSWLVDSYFEAFEHDADYTARVPFDIAKKEDVEQSDLDALTLLHRAIHFKRNKNYSAAQRDIWTLVAKDMEAEGLTVEDRALAFNLHASLLYVVGDVHTAIEAINKSLELQPTLVNSLVKKGGFLAELGETDEATSCFSEAMELDSNEADVHLHLGQMELLDGNYYKAAQCLRRCISRSDALPVTHVSYGMALYKSGSTYQAKDVFEEASKMFPKSAEVHLFYGEVLADQGNYANAMRHFLTAWELSPQCPLPFLNAGRVYVGTNDPMRAIAHFKQALEVDPRCSSAHLDIAQVLFAQGRTDEAFEHFEVAASCCRFLPEVEEVCACQAMAKMQLKVTEILGVELRHIMRSK
ncbi:Mitochondrial Protein Translocase (MPT) Family [Phytophthora infestans T30-4]|uniref:Mitochondrial Protein Translocase (MPT) Family n=1 Tax=Phytophthora infestans (strain T30-4) TaxID=403677 RepID=D0MXZ8_PHYIT|nr:Mitochondrial Protein Translocase (MPT) Family [Phytophthora infestans T30-4]EEY66046.1 Mitochondrial Protein Translocase (MPT) Family [Phytophthora infestans T30-4]|eukprot:XP_002906645.1 Mitochondrial Protein Translocase (MPT) Family [Phytophthora infestans T30-4]